MILVYTNAMDPANRNSSDGVASKLSDTAGYLSMVTMPAIFLFLWLGLKWNWLIALGVGIVSGFIVALLLVMLVAGSKISRR